MKNSLYKNINARKKAGTSRPKSKSTISKEAYSNMKAGFPRKKRKKGLMSWLYLDILQENGNEKQKNINGLLALWLLFLF